MEQKTKILVCEDDENLGMLLREYLRIKNYDVDLFPDGELGFKAFSREKYDLCILDVMMPKKDGFTLAQDIRALNNSVPIIFLSAKSLKEDVLEGFRSGADDYMTKPFNMEELIFRIEAILKRTNSQKERAQTSFEFGKFTFDAKCKELVFEDEIMHLTTKETDLLMLLARNGTNVLERNYALKTIWIDDNYFNARSMDVYITKLRKKLQKDPTVQILNVHGKGYKLIYPEKEQD